MCLRQDSISKGNWPAFLALLARGARKFDCVGSQRNVDKWLKAYPGDAKQSSTQIVPVASTRSAIAPPPNSRPGMDLVPYGYDTPTSVAQPFPQKRGRPAKGSEPDVVMRAWVAENRAGIYKMRMAPDGILDSSNSQQMNEYARRNGNSDKTPMWRFPCASGLLGQRSNSLRYIDAHEVRVSHERAFLSFHANGSLAAEQQSQFVLPYNGHVLGSGTSVLDQLAQSAELFLQAGCPAIFTKDISHLLLYTGGRVVVRSAVCSKVANRLGPYPECAKLVDGRATDSLAQSIAEWAYKLHCVKSTEATKFGLQRDVQLAIENATGSDYQRLGLAGTDLAKFTQSTSENMSMRVRRP